MNVPEVHTIQFSASTLSQRLKMSWVFVKAALMILFTGTSRLPFRKKITP